MDKVSKIVASAPKLGKRDSLIPSSSTLQTKAEEVRLPEHKKKAAIYPRKLQVPVTLEQEMLLDQIAKKLQGNRAGRGGESINANTVVRCLIQLLKDIQIEDEVALSEESVRLLIKTKLGI